MAKWVAGTYRTDGHATSWLKIKNPEDTQIRDCHELFDAPGVRRSQRSGRQGRRNRGLRKAEQVVFWRTVFVCAPTRRGDGLFDE
jgi:hypothetical protein